MSMLSVENLYKTYGEKVLFDHLSFSISEKHRIGLIGVNGTGKSTLLKYLAGLETAESGTMTHANQFHIEYLPQQSDLNEELTVLDQIYYGEAAIMKGMRDYEKALASLEENPADEKKQAALMAMQQKVDELNAWDAITTAKTVLTRLGVTSFTKKISELSGGQKKRVAIAKALIQPANLLILDEPTNHLDQDTIEWLEAFLAQYKGAFIVVTHDRYFLNRVTNQIFELDKGQLYTYEGNYEMFLEKKAEREELAVQSEAKHHNTLRRELAWLRRGAKARTTKQKARIQRVEDMKEQKFDNTKHDLQFALGSVRLGKKVMELTDVSKRFADLQLVQDFSYLVVPGDRLGLIGPNGSGKTTLLNMLAGRIEPDSGMIEVGETVKIGYYTQDHSDMDENLRMIDYIKETAEIVHTIDGTSITAEQMLERFLFPRSMQFTYIRKLSGGERRRLYLLNVLMQEPNVLFLDEPTNDLDTQTLRVLEEYLDHFPGVVITVSHDRYFLDRVIDQLFVFKGQGNIERFYGNYTEYMEERKKQTAAKKELKAAELPQAVKETRKKLSYKEQQEWNGLEDQIAALEEKLSELQANIDGAGSDFGKIQKLMEEQKAAEERLEYSMQRWEELSLILEEIEQAKS
ncbi:ABC-F family ATP-binding cassette domain-containing protein [Bacillus sp. SJS]|uniref:ABC-F family ATP-binding cassette domain-containing protein n=1 Tax=Bacillus sp. SJS TaxID=1423321 RepID=UPI0004DCC804|nr:ABC-F family ATP-binding cassette domain-containing protein [Bacillus sp. SJS]KZZ84022.1 multidrug ABC transporter ATP-binding protein [Bacillus sp. SJS]